MDARFAREGGIVFKKRKRIQCKFGPLPDEAELDYLTI